MDTWPLLELNKMNKKGPVGDVITDDKEQRIRVITTILTWTAEEFQELGQPDSAELILSIRDKMASKLGH